MSVHSHGSHTDGLGLATALTCYRHRLSAAVDSLPPAWRPFLPGACRRAWKLRACALQARAVLYFGWDEVAQVLEATVGPLPHPTNYTFVKTIPWNTRPPNTAEYYA